MYLKCNIIHTLVSKKEASKPFGSWRAEYDFFIHDPALLVENFEHDSLPIKNTYKPGDKVYLLYAVYSTGDSFGTSERGAYELIRLFDNYETAELNKNRLRSISGFKNSKSYILNENGDKENFYIPWLGYFENLNELEIKEIKIVT